MRSYFLQGAFLALLTFLAVPLYGSENAAEIPILEVETLNAPRFEGPQFVGADSKGRIHILRTEGGLRSYRLRDGEFDKPGRLQEKPVEGFGFVLDAAMNRHGDWLILDGLEARLFKSGKEVVLPALSWKPDSVALLDSDPVAVVFPFPMGRMSKEERRNPPFVVTAEKDEWRTLVESEYDEPPSIRERMGVEPKIAAKLYADSDDTLWAAHHYRYKVVRYSKAGRELLSIEVDGAEVAHREEENLEDNRIELEEARAGYANPERAKIEVFTAVSTILDLTEGRDGKLYLLTKGGEGGGLTLDRYDGVLGTLKRVGLGLTTLGQMSMASGKDGLYLVPFSGKDKRHMVSWEEIDQAKWVPIEGVKIDGMDAVQVEAAE